MLTARQVLELTSIFAAFVSGMTLFWAGLGVRWEEQTWKGLSERELAVRRRQTIMMAIGIPAAFVALIAQTIVILKF